MATIQSPPILVWQPGGGTPVGPISNPPVYSQSGVTQLIEGQAYIDIVFGAIQTTTDWVLVACEVENTTDADPLNIWPGIITERTADGFRIQLNGFPDSNHYYLQWAVSGVNILPVPATSYRLFGPASGGVEDAVFTIALHPSTTVVGSAIVTPHDGGAGGTFSPPTVALSNASPSQTVTYFPAAYGAVTISATNDHILTDPASIVFTSTTPTYSLSGPSTGAIGVASSNFTVALSGGVIGTLTVTPSAGGGGGTFTPTTVALTTGSPSATFTYTPASGGTKTISVTNNGGLANPGNLSYVVPLAQHLLATLESYWKLEEIFTGVAVTRVDSHGSNNLTDNFGTAYVQSTTGIITNAAYFYPPYSSYLSHASNASLQVTGDFTFSCWIKLGAQGAWTLIAKSDFGGGTNQDYEIDYDATDGFKMLVNYGGPTTVAQTNTPVADGVWTHVVAWHDAATGKQHLRINDATTYVSSAGVTLVQSATAFNMGRRPMVGAEAYANAVVDEVGFWKRLLTADEITTLYNGGAAFPYSSFAA